MWALKGLALIGVSQALMCIPVQADNEKFIVPRVEFPIEGGFSKTELDYFAHVLRTEGIVALSNVPGLKEARNNCLTSLVQCYHNHELRDVLSIQMKDGTKRVTLALNGERANNDFGCDGLGEKINQLQSIVKHASTWFARALDGTLVDGKAPLFMAVNNAKTPSYKTFESVVENSVHLDHFHVYETQPATKSNKETLEMHTDEGLFVAFLPSLHFQDFVVDEEFDDDGFQVQIGEIVKQVVFPSDAVVFMLGDGVHNWMPPSMKELLRPVPHRLILNHDLAQQQRVWFGRMFFPPKDAYIALQQTTFAKVRSLATTKHLDNYVGCSSPQNRQLRDLTNDNACKAGEIYCWMGCRDITQLNCTSTQSIQCVNSADGAVWTNDKETTHCYTCTAQCYTDPSSSASNDTSPDNKDTPHGFCNTGIYPTNMYMDGFNGFGEDIPCLVFLFKSWVMNTPAKFAFGSLGAFSIGLVIEWLISVRREMKSTRRNIWITRALSRAQPNSRKYAVVMIVLYGTQLVLAYLAMLLAMSFSAIIFAMVMLGLTTGHYVFNFDVAQVGGNEACCAANDVGLDESSEETSSTSNSLSEPILPSAAVTNSGDVATLRDNTVGFA